jgi:hypothetical protein
MEKLVDIVKDNTAKFTHVVENTLYYKIETEKMVYIFAIDMNDNDDVVNATFNYEHKSINLMRYLIKSLTNNSLVYYEK